MATIRKRVGRAKKLQDGSVQPGRVTYTAMVRRTGFPTRTATFNTRDKAKRWATTVEAEMIEGRHFKDAAARRRTVGEAIDRYVKEEVPRKRGGGGMHTTALRWWKEKIGDIRLSAVTPDILVDQRSKLAAEKYARATPGTAKSTLEAGEAAPLYARSPSTVNRYMECMSHVFTVARREWRWNLSSNPFSDISKLREDNGRTRFLSDDERKRLLAETAKDPQLHVLVTLALATAARAGELVGLTWADVDLRKKDARLLFHVTKNAQPRTVWVHGGALKLLREHHARRDESVAAVFPGAKGKDGQPGRYDYIKPFKEAVKVAKVEPFTFHCLRHSAATYLAMQGATEQQLRAIGGWKSGVVSRYVHLAAEDAKDAMLALANKLDGKKGKAHA
jgi:integrase